MSQDLYHARKRASSAEERSRRQWCNKRFELSSTTSATLGSDGECLVGEVPKEPETYLDQPSRDLAVVWSASNERAKPSAMECQSTRPGGLRRSLARIVPSTAINDRVHVWCNRISVRHRVRHARQRIERRN